MQQELTELSHYERLRQQYKSISMKYQQESIPRYFNLKMKPTDDPVTGCYTLTSFFSALDFLTVNPTVIYIREEGGYKADDKANMFTVYSRFLMNALEEHFSGHKKDTKRIMLLVAPYGMGKTHFTRLFLAYSMKLKKDEDINGLEMQSPKGIPARFEIDYLVKSKDFGILESFLANTDRNKITLLGFMLRNPLGWCIFDSGESIAKKLKKITECHTKNFLMIIPASPVDIVYLEKFEKEFLDKYAQVIVIAHYKNSMRNLFGRKLQYISSTYEDDYSFSVLEKIETIRENTIYDFIESSAISKLLESCKGNPAVALKLLEKSLEITLQKSERLVSEETMVRALKEMNLHLNEYQLGLRVTKEREGIGRLNYLISLLGSSKKRAAIVSRITKTSVARVSTLFKGIEGLQKNGREYSFTKSLLILLEEEIIKRIVNDELDEFTVFENLRKRLNTESIEEAYRS